MELRLTEYRQYYSTETAAVHPNDAHLVLHYCSVILSHWMVILLCYRNQTLRSSFYAAVLIGHITRLTWSFVCSSVPYGVYGLTTRKQRV